MSPSSRHDRVGQGRFKTRGKFRVRISQQGFGSFSGRNGFHKSFITNELAWTLTWTTPGFDSSAALDRQAHPRRKTTLSPEVQSS